MRRTPIEKLQGHFWIGDCEKVLQRFPNDSIDFVLTSPPYADKRDYGTEGSSVNADDYVAWFLPKARQIYRVLKQNGSFVLNISDKVVGDFQHLYVFELVLTTDEVNAVCSDHSNDTCRDGMPPDQTRMSG